MKTIPLTQGYSAIVDDEDFHVLSKYRWCVTKSGKNIYAVRNPSRVDGKRKLILMHRDIVGKTDKLRIDHANRNSLDNRRSNLRPATNGENTANCGLKRSNRSGFKGVFWSTRDKIWRCVVGGKHVGLFKDRLLAAKKYNEAALKRWGEFANLNQIGVQESLTP